MLILQAEARMDIEGLEDGTDNSVRSDAYMYDAEKLMEDWDELELNLITIRAFEKKYFPENIVFQKCGNQGHHMRQVKVP